MINLYVSPIHILYLYFVLWVVWSLGSSLCALLVAPKHHVPMSIMIGLVKRINSYLQRNKRWLCGSDENGNVNEYFVSYGLMHKIITFWKLESYAYYCVDYVSIIMAFNHYLTKYTWVSNIYSEVSCVYVVCHTHLTCV